MAGPALLNFIILVSLAVEGFSLSMNDILGFGYRRLVESEAPRVVEVVRWRQPVCLTAAPGVLPCLLIPKNPSRSGNESPVGEADAKISAAEGDSGQGKNGGDSASVEEEIGDRSTRKKPGKVPVPRLYSPRIIHRVRLDEIGDSGFRNPLPDGGRGSRYLRVAGRERGKTIYEIKVVDSPVVANLVAETCLPDIGIALCDETNENSETSGHQESSLQYRKPLDSKKPVSVIAKPPVSVPVISGDAVGFWGAEGPGYGLADLSNKPSVVQTDEEPALEHVLVVQPTSSPGIFSGINALLPLGGGGSLFDMFYNKPSGVDKPSGVAGWNPLPLPLPGILQIPSIPSLGQIIYKPENDISGNQGILGLLTGGDKIPPGAGPPTEKPGIFGGLFASPSKPVDFDVQASTSSASSSLLEGIGNIFKPANRPLIVERPNEKPILIENPIYVIERPASLGLFDLLQTGIQSPQLRPDEKPEVIKDPIYVFQKPVTNSPLFGAGLLPNWNIFGGPSSGASTNEASEAEAEAILSEPDGEAEEPIVPLIDIRFPETPESSVSTAFSAAAATAVDSSGLTSAAAVSLATTEEKNKDLKAAPSQLGYHAGSNGDSDGEDSLKNIFTDGDRPEAEDLPVEADDPKEKSI